MGLISRYVIWYILWGAAPCLGVSLLKTDHWASPSGGIAHCGMDSVEAIVLSGVRFVSFVCHFLSIVTIENTSRTSEADL